MDRDEIIKHYFDAWNELDVGSLLQIMHAGAAYHDAFWAETCVGPDLGRYFQDAMDEEPYWFNQIDDAVSTENGVVFRYSAHDRAGSITDEPVLSGAEILHLRRGKILTVTDIYCSPVQSDLEELAMLAVNRHGLSSYANSGLGALKSSRIKEALSATVNQEKIFLDPNITMLQLAEKIGCTLEQLSIVLETQFGSEFEQFLDAQRIEFAKTMLENNPNHADSPELVAASSGFRSVREFSEKFAEFVGVAPTDYCRKHKKTPVYPENPGLH